VPTCGVVYVHSTPLAVCQHVEWAIARVLTAPVNLHWTGQPVDPGARRAECDWTGRPGTGAELAAALRQWPMIRFEVTEEPSPGVDGERFCHVPTLGLWSGRTSANGDIVVGEDRLRSLLQEVPASRLAGRVNELLGSAWDDALEPFRLAGDGAAGTLLHRVG
jgi:hypothetical protein